MSASYSANSYSAQPCRNDHGDPEMGKPHHCCSPTIAPQAQLTSSRHRGRVVPLRLWEAVNARDARARFAETGKKIRFSRSL
jgi:hypothetical protein